MKKSNGYFQLSHKPDGTYLKLYPPKGDGKEITFNELSEYLTQNQIYDYDIKTIRTAFLSKEQFQEIKIMDQSVAPINESFKLTISEDCLYAFARFYPSSTKGKILSQEEILNTLKQTIKYGIVGENIEAHLRNPRYCQDIILAQGKDKIESKSAYINYHFNINQCLKPKLNEDGTVDFHQLDIISGVEKGDVLATLYPGDLGEVGIDIYGNKIHPSKIKKLSIKYGKNTHLSEDKLSLISDISGHVKIRDEKIWVNNTFIVKDHIDTSTGDIDYDGNVHVQGNVINGFSIRAKEDVIIHGVVEGAYIEAGGDIIIQHGIQGMNRGCLKAGGNVISKFIENAEISAEGYITTSAILHSNVSAKGDITVLGGKGLITGGKVSSQTLIHGKCAGSSMGTKVTLEVNQDIDSAKKWNKLQEQVEKNKIEIEKLTRVLKSYNQKIKNGEKIPDYKLEYLKIATNHCIQLHTDTKELAIQLKELSEYKKKNKIGNIIIEKKVYPGVRISIGETHYYVKDNLKYTRFSSEKGQIKLNNI